MHDFDVPFLPESFQCLVWDEAWPLVDVDALPPWVSLERL